ncbi:MAG: hypothetical protein ACFFEF_11570 [Candidatus Thorarchaeota archaeon]
MGDDEDFIMEEFEWALKDPTEEKLRQLGEVVSIITGKLIDAFGSLEKNIEDLDSRIGALESRMDSLANRIASGATVGPSAAADAAPGMASAPVAKAPSPKPAGGGMSMMGELKALLAARRTKADGATGTSE